MKHYLINISNYLKKKEIKNGKKRMKKVIILKKKILTRCENNYAIKKIEWAI